MAPPTGLPTATGLTARITKRPGDTHTASINSAAFVPRATRTTGLRQSAGGKGWLSVASTSPRATRQALGDFVLASTHWVARCRPQLRRLPHAPHTTVGARGCAPAPSSTVRWARWQFKVCRSLAPTPAVPQPTRTTQQPRLLALRRAARGFREATVRGTWAGMATDSFAHSPQFVLRLEHDAGAAAPAAHDAHGVHGGHGGRTVVMLRRPVRVSALPAPRLLRRALFPREHSFISGCACVATTLCSSTAGWPWA